MSVAAGGMDVTRAAVVVSVGHRLGLVSGRLAEMCQPVRQQHEHAAREGEAAAAPLAAGAGRVDVQRPGVLRARHDLEEPGEDLGHRPHSTNARGGRRRA